MTNTLKVITAAEKEYEISFDDKAANKGTINGNPFDWDVINIKPGSYHIIKDNQSLNIEVVKADYETKDFTIKVNGELHSLKLKDRFDILLQDLGLDDLNSNKLTELKAPMPGLVLDIKVKVGDEVNEGDALIVLEAMKMENVIKSTGSGTVKRIDTKKGNAVEKNQLLIQFD